jgi:arylsulfatase A-like enzyme
VTRYDHVLPAEAVLAAERFKDAGYRTLGVFRNGWVESNFGFSQGFDVYFKPSASRTAGRYQRRSPGTRALQGSDLDATEGAIELIRAHEDERFFLYVHYMDVHQYQYDDVAAEQAFGNAYSDAYDSAVHWVDRNVGRLLLELEERDLFERTLVVIASDHGEGFYEHQQEGHARTLYREVTEVPLIIGLPFRLEPGIVVRPLVSNVDIWPTVLDMVGLPSLPPGDGRSLLPLIEQAADPGAGEAPSADSSNVVVSYLDRNWGRTKKGPRPLVSVRRWPYRLVYLKERPQGAELFDHSADPTEQRDLAAEDPERVKELRALMEEHLSLDPMEWTESAETVELDELHLNQLRALGYVIK